MCIIIIMLLWRVLHLVIEKKINDFRQQIKTQECGPSQSGMQQKTVQQGSGSQIRDRNPDPESTSQKIQENNYPRSTQHDILQKK